MHYAINDQLIKCRQFILEFLNFDIEKVLEEEVTNADSNENK
jgi:hypothetical protein